MLLTSPFEVTSDSTAKQLKFRRGEALRAKSCGRKALAGAPNAARAQPAEGTKRSVGGRRAVCSFGENTRKAWVPGGYSWNAEHHLWLMVITKDRRATKPFHTGPKKELCCARLVLFAFPSMI